MLLNWGVEELRCRCFRKCVGLWVDYEADAANLDILGASLWGLPHLKMANTAFISCSGPEEVLESYFP